MKRFLTRATAIVVTCLCVLTISFQCFALDTAEQSILSIRDAIGQCNETIALCAAGRYLNQQRVETVEAVADTVCELIEGVKQSADAAWRQKKHEILMSLKSEVWGDVVPAGYGSVYATMEIPSVGLSVGVQWGDDQAMIDARKYVCSYSGSGAGQFGYAGCHLLCAHNNGHFASLAGVRVGDRIIVTTSYGRYVYSVTSCVPGNVTADGGNIVGNNGTALIDFGIGTDTIFAYTCYPFGYYGATNQRYVVRAELVE